MTKTTQLMTTTTLEKRANFPSSAHHPATTDADLRVDDAVTLKPTIQIPLAPDPNHSSIRHLRAKAHPLSKFPSGTVIRESTWGLGGWVTNEIVASVIVCLVIWLVFMGLSYLP